MQIARLCFLRQCLRSAGSLTVLFACTMIAARAQTTKPPTWQGYAGNAQHTALSAIAAQSLQTIHWQTPVDLILAHYLGGDLYIHYGSPLITQQNTVVVTVRTTAQNTFEVHGIGGYAGELKWVQKTDYTTPPSGWIPSCGPTLTPNNTLYIPAAGGTLLQVSNIDRPQIYSKRLAFYGLTKYNADAAKLNSLVYVDTPITSDKAGNLYFGFQVTGANSAGLVGGLARIGADGTGTWVSAATVAGDGGMTKVTNNCAPAISNDGSLVYFSVNSGSDSFGNGYLVAVDSKTLAPMYHVALKDPKTGNNAIVADDGTASPTVGPDDDVYYGVLEDGLPGTNDDRGWMLHFKKNLVPANSNPNPTGYIGDFGWDDSASIVPATAVPGYKGTSKYLLLTKYNNYADFGTRDGENKVAILDPDASMTDPYGTGATVMKEVITVLGPTPNTGLKGVREWCINTAAIDPITKCALINSEDGTLYRWDFTTNSLTEKVILTSGIGEAYTPTVIGPDGTVYAVNDALLFAVGSNSPDVSKVVTVNLYTMRSGTAPNTKFQLVKVTNVSNCTLPGPISLVLDNLSANATLVSANGTTANAAPLGSPYVTLSTGNLAAGGSVTVTLTFRNQPLNAAINYKTRVLAGPGAP
jgi:hypothetical protein